MIDKKGSDNFMESIKFQRTVQLAKSTLILVFAKILSQGASFLLLPIYTNKLSTAEYGTIDLITTIILIGWPLVSIQIEMGVFRFFIISDSKKNESEVVTSGFGLLCINVLLLSVMYLIFTSIWNVQFSLYVWLLIVIEAYNAFLLQLCRARGDNVGYGLCTSAIVIIKSVFCILFLLRYGLTIIGFLYSELIAQLLGLIFLVYKSGIYEYVKANCFKLTLAADLLRYSIPLVFNQIASWVINFSDRIIIVMFLEVGANGIYSAASKLSNIIYGVLAMFNLAWAENITRNMQSNDNNRYISKAFNVYLRLLLLAITIIIGVLACAFNLLIGMDYIDAYNHVPILLLAMVFSGAAAFLGSVYTAYGITKEIAITTILTALINIIINIGLISSIKIYAASISTLVAFFFLLVFRSIKLNKLKLLDIQMKGVYFSFVVYAATWILYSKRMKTLCLLIVLLATVALIKMVINETDYLKKRNRNMGE